MTVASYERLRRDLITGALAPGSRLKISDLFQSTAINLSAIREALSKLTAEGLVIALPQHGFRAAPVSSIKRWSKPPSNAMAVDCQKSSGHISKSRLAGVNYFFRRRQLFLPVLSLHHWSTIAQSDARSVRSSGSEISARLRL